MGVIARVRRRCRHGQLDYRAGSIYYAPNKRTGRTATTECSASCGSRQTYKRSLKGAGPAGLPVS